MAASAQPRYDLLLKGDHVVDAKNGITAVRDVAIANGRIAAVSETIAPSEAMRTVDAKGLYVAPGLVDVHVFAATMDRVCQQRRLGSRRFLPTAMATKRHRQSVECTRRCISDDAPAVLY
jgi:predicted amidohydrolase